MHGPRIVKKHRNFGQIRNLQTSFPHRHFHILFPKPSFFNPHSAPHQPEEGSQRGKDQLLRRQSGFPGASRHGRKRQNDSRGSGQYIQPQRLTVSDRQPAENHRKNQRTSHLVLTGQYFSARPAKPYRSAGTGARSSVACRKDSPVRTGSFSVSAQFSFFFHLSVTPPFRLPASHSSTFNPLGNSASRLTAPGRTGRIHRTPTPSLTALTSSFSSSGVRSLRS